MLLSGVFDFDPDKSAANLAKHGIDFETAQALWLDDARVEFDTQFVDERRTLVVGMIDGKHWTAVVTMREGATRIISVRRSRDSEMRIYERQND
jgi:uncharacterized protein